LRLVLLEAIPAIYGPRAIWLERNLAFFLAFCAGCLVHLAWTAAETIPSFKSHSFIQPVALRHRYLEKAYSISIYLLWTAPQKVDSMNNDYFFSRGPFLMEYATARPRRFRASLSQNRTNKFIIVQLFLIPDTFVHWCNL
jgi:hypothetical protein